MPQLSDSTARCGALEERGPEKEEEILVLIEQSEHDQYAHLFLAEAHQGRLYGYLSHM